MLLNFRLALRNLRKHRFFSVINLLGLGLGLTVFIFSVLVLRYETNHDHMFAKRDRIVTVGSQFSASSGEPISQYPNIRMAYGPLIQAEVPGIDRVVRSKFERRQIRTPQGAFYLGIRFVDSSFTELFDFHYLHGSAAALAEPFTLALTATSAQKLFGTVSAMGLTVLLDQRWPLRVAAIIEDVGVDSHFNSSLMPDVELTSFSDMSTLVATSDFSLAGEWTSLQPTDLTYLLLPKNTDLVVLNDAVNAVAARHANAEEQAYISALNIRPLQYHHTQVWDSLRFPVIETLALMGFLVLLAAALNYANLASLQHASRAREWGLRKTFGAKPYQLLRQLLMESVVLVAIATWLAFTLVEILMPLFNHWSGKLVVIDHVRLMPQLVLLVGILGLAAGIYPALEAANYGASEALRKGLVDSAMLRRHGVPKLRQLLVAGQFAIATFILALVAVIVLQNNRVQSLSDVFSRERVLVVEDMALPALQSNLREFQQALQQLSGVQTVSSSESVPYLRVGKSSLLPETGEELLLGEVASNFFSLYPIPLLRKAETWPQFNFQAVPVVINALAAHILGVDDLDVALGHQYHAEVDGARVDYQVVGVMPTQYFLGVHMRQRPIVFAIGTENYPYWSVKFQQPLTDSDVARVDALWQHYFPDYPINRFSLDHYFFRFFKIPTMIGKVVSLFAGIAAFLAIIGLLGLAVFAARQREKELGLRKVMGATGLDLLGLLMRQFAAPVLGALVVALPLAYFSAQIYLRFFPEHISHVWLVISLAGCVALLIATAVLVCQAFVIAQGSPSRSLQKI